VDCDLDEDFLDLVRFVDDDDDNLERVDEVWFESVFLDDDGGALGTRLLK